MEELRNMQISEEGNLIRDDEIETYLNQINAGWRIGNNKTLVKTYQLYTFPDLIEMVRRVGMLGKIVGHSPSIICLFKTTIKITIGSEDIQSLSTNDFLLASKIDELIECDPESRKPWSLKN